MMNYKTIAYSKQHPVQTGLLGVTAVFLAGIAIAFATGFVTPEMIKAQVVTPPCCVVVPPPAPPTPPPPPPPPPVTPPVVPPLPPEPEPQPVIPAIPPLSAICTGAPASVLVGETVTWNVLASGSNGIYTYSWSGTDGLSSSDPSLGFEYLTPGTKTADVTVTTSTETVTASCAVTVTTSTVPPIPEAPICVLSVSPSAIGVGGSSSLTWTTQNGNSFSIDNGIGAVSVAGGSMTVSPIVTTTYTGTVSGDGGTATCSDTVTVTSTPPPPAPICVLTASPSTITSGGSSVLSWTSENASFAFIDNGIDNVSPVSAGNVTVSPTADTTYTLTVGGGLSGLEATCTANISIETGGGSSSGGGGGGGGSRRSGVTLDLLKLPSEAPFASVYLSQIPYTGLSLTGAGMILYWLGLVGLIGLISYFILFKLFPSIHSFSERVVTAVRDTPTTASISTPAAPVAPVVQTAAVAPEVPVIAPALVEEVVAPVAPSPREDESAYSPFHGFRSFGSSEKITIDDIVKGLSRLPAVEFVDDAVDTVTDSIASAATAGTEMVKDGYRALVSALMKRDREAAFTALRAAVAGGETPERVMTQAVCAIDDVYRNRIDGAACDPELQNICAPCETKELEHMVSSLTTAVDASYSTGVTGAKLALVRALDSSK